MQVTIEKDPEVKKCPVCGRTKPLSEYGEKWACMECHDRRAKSSKRWRHAKKKEAAPAGFKRCGACLKAKPEAEFLGKKWCPTCLDSREAIKKKWAQKKALKPVPENHKRCTGCLRVYHLDIIGGFNSCPKCRKSYRHTANSIRARKVSTPVVGAVSLCKKCLRILAREEFGKFKMCPRCREEGRIKDPIRYKGPELLPHGKKYCGGCRKIKNEIAFGSRKICKTCRRHDRLRHATIPPEVRRARARASRARIGKEKILLQQRAYQQKPSTRRLMRRWRRWKRKTDIQFKIAMICRSRIGSAIKRAKAGKAFHSHELIGCSWETLKAHIESRFKPGMTWDNHGLNTWHIDHVRACTRFDLTDPQQQLECFNWKNLQPLWAAENIRKGNKLPEELAA